MQVYKGLEIVTNKITQTEKQGVRHSLLEQSVLNRRVDMRVDEMVNAEQSVLNQRVDLRVDEMVNARLVYEVQQIFIRDADYTKGIRQFIGVPEMDRYLREETNMDEDDESKKMILQSSIANIKCTKMNTFINNNKFNKKKVVFIMGAIEMGKFRLSVDLATHFQGEIINSDKRQIYKGVEIVTNKITYTEKQGVRHYLLDSDFTAKDFCLQAIVYIEIFWKTERVPVIVGGSNSYIEKLVEDPVFMLKYKYDTCFILIYVEQSVLNRRVDMRVDEIVNAGEIEPDFNFTAGDFCLQAIGNIEIILKTQRVLIIVGGSNLYIEKLVEDLVFIFKYKYDTCFIWIDVNQSILDRKVDIKVDEIVDAGLVDEMRLIFNLDADYTKVIRRSIGVPVKYIYLREETNIDKDDESK
ncbi:hypothetical protein MTR67_018347 [Solanum verrucosum]|uniref:Isopentenyltransferase n=1 Tax=Solanum verrucosum TaxID=315347 RepID=A0AAF0QLJ7_SOLVR|nr:hypothetical protein MTR67_018347 [Solanum verrucosum]